MKRWEKVTAVLSLLLCVLSGSVSIWYHAKAPSHKLGSSPTWLDPLLNKAIAQNLTTLTNRSTLNFNGGGFSVVDDPTNGVTTVTNTGSAPAPLFFAGLNALTASGRSIAFLDGYASVGDGGGGLFFWSGTSTATNDSCTTSNGGSTSGGVGRWLRIYSGPISARYCGATGNGQTVSDCTIASGSPTLSCLTSHPFTANDVGKLITVQGAGASATTLATTIASFNSSSSIVLNANAGTTIALSYNVTAFSYGSGVCTATANPNGLVPGQLVTVSGLGGISGLPSMPVQIRDVMAGGQFTFVNCTPSGAYTSGGTATDTGAIVDWGTNDSAAIALAFTAANTPSNLSGEVRFPTGTYMIGSPLPALAAGLTLSGENQQGPIGSVGSKIKAGASMSYLLQLGNAVSSTDQAYRNIWLHGNHLAADVVKIQYFTTNVSFDHAVFTDAVPNTVATPVGGNLVHFTATPALEIDNVRFTHVKLMQDYNVYDTCANAVIMDANTNAFNAISIENFVMWGATTLVRVVGGGINLNHGTVFAYKPSLSSMLSYEATQEMIWEDIYTEAANGIPMVVETNTAGTVNGELSLILRNLAQHDTTSAINLKCKQPVIIEGGDFAGLINVQPAGGGAGVYPVTSIGANFTQSLGAGFAGAGYPSMVREFGTTLTTAQGTPNVVAKVDSSGRMRVPIGTAASYASNAWINAGMCATRAGIEIDTPYSVGGTIQVGDTFLHSRFVDSTIGQVNPQVAGYYPVELNVCNTAQGPVTAYIGGSPGAGAGFFVFDWDTVKN